MVLPEFHGKRHGSIQATVVVEGDWGLHWLGRNQELAWRVGAALMGRKQHVL